MENRVPNRKRGKKGSGPLRDRNTEAEANEDRENDGNGEGPVKQQSSASMLSFEDMKQQLNLWQGRFDDLSGKQSELQQLQQSKTSLEEKYQKALQQLKENHSESTEQARKLAQKGVECQQLAKEMEEAQATLKDKFIELAKEQDASDALRRQLKEMADAQKDAQRRKVGMEAEAASLKAELAASRMESSRHKSRCEQFETEIAQAQESIESNRSEAYRLGQDLAAQQDLSEKQLVRFQKCEDELAEVRVTLENFTVDNSRLEEKTSKLEAQLEAAEDLQQQMRRECDEKAAFIEQQQAQIHELESAAEALQLQTQRECHEKAAFIQQQQSQIQDLELATKDLQQKMQSECDEKAAFIQQQQAQIHDLESAAMEFQQQMQRECDEKAAFTQQQQTQIHILESEVTTLRADLADASQLSEQRQSQTVSLEEKLLALNAEMDSRSNSFQNELEAAAEARASLQEQLNNKQSEFSSTFEEQLADLNQKEEQIQILEDKLLAAKDELENERKEVSCQVALEKELRQTMETQCQQLADSARDQEALRSRIQELGDERAAYEQQLIEDLKATATADQKALIDELQQLRRQLQDERQESAVEKQKLALEVEAANEEVKDLRESLPAAQEEAQMWRKRAEELVRRRQASAAAAARWDGADAAWDWLLEKEQIGQEICESAAAPELRLQVRELCLSLRQMKQDCELLEAENLGLKEAVNVVEEDLDHVSGQHAQLIGHVNHRQKIKYTMKLKEENNRLCQELKKARQRNVQLEVAKETESLLDALASVGALLGHDQPASHQKSRVPCTPKRVVGSYTPSVQRSSLGRSPPNASAKTGASGRSSAASCRPGYASPPPPTHDFEDSMRLEEAERRCEQQQQSLERISVDFSHLKALMERAVQLTDTEQRNGAKGGNFAALLQRLREIIAANHRCRKAQEHAAEEAMASPAEASITTNIADDSDEELEMLRDGFN